MVKLTLSLCQGALSKEVEETGRILCVPLVNLGLSINCLISRSRLPIDIVLDSNPRGTTPKICIALWRTYSCLEESWWLEGGCSGASVFPSTKWA